MIGAFEGTIDKLVALAAFMPGIASVGGNTGNQPAALLIRGLALDQIGHAILSRFLLKELGIGLVAARPAQRLQKVHGRSAHSSLNLGRRYTSM